jgi:hypothetical protein
MLPATTFIGLPGGDLVQADDIRYNRKLNKDGFFDAWVVFDSSNLAPAGITCEAFGGETITLILQSAADVTVSGSKVVAGEGEQSHGDFTATRRAVVSCEIPATVGPCNKP